MTVGLRPPRWISLVVVAQASACASPTESGRGYFVEELDRWVAGEAANALGADGRSQLPPWRHGPTGAVVAPGQAAALAQALVRTFYLVPSDLSDLVEERRGASIDFEALRPDPRVTYVNSPYLPLPDDVPPATQRAFEPFYLVWLGRDAPTLSVGVASQSTHVTIDPEGRIVLPRVYGNEFWVQATPASSLFTFPLSPEQAVVYVGELSGTRTTTVPELFWPAEPYFPQVAYWRLTLEAPVTVREIGEDTARSTSVLYVTSSPAGGTVRVALAIPSATQPRSQPIEYFRGDTIASGQIGIRQDWPAVFIRVELVN